MPKESGRSIVVMAKPVGSRCNMQCRYCYYLEKGKFSTHRKQTRMSFDMLERLIRQTIECCSGPVVSFVWHGGEPTLAGIDFYEKAVELERKYLPAGWQVWNNIQTNGLLINDAWCSFLKKNRFDVGVSIDGDQLIHDANRKDRGGNGTYLKVKKAVERLMKAGIMPDLLCTVNSGTVKDPLRAYRALRDLGTGWIQFIPIVVRKPDGSFSDETVKPEDYGRFLCEVFDEWVTNDLGKTDVQLFAETARVWNGGEASLCWMAPTCGQVLVAEEDGGVYACDHFVDTDHRLGTLGKDKLYGMANSGSQTEFGNSKRDSLTAQCRRCPWLPCCGGGCPKDRFGTSTDGENGQYWLCRGLEMYFSHADRPLHRVMELSKSGKKPEEIMEILKAE